MHLCASPEVCLNTEQRAGRAVEKWKIGGDLMRRRQLGPDQWKRFGMAEIAPAEEGVVMEAAAMSHGASKWI